MQFSDPIPDMSDCRLRRVGARSYPILSQALENTECAVDVRLHGIAGMNYYHREDNPPYWHRAPGAIPELYVREGILGRLVEVNASLVSLGYELFLFDAYRPVEVQNYFHDTWVPSRLRAQFPTWSEAEVQNEVDRYWAKGAESVALLDPLSPPPHATGGVVDLTLRKRGTQELLFMGGEFDEVSPVSFIDYLECRGTKHPLTLAEEDARKNRRLLYWAMHALGFVVNPNEWWHFGYGDQLSAKLSGAPHAVYSVLKV